MLETIHLYHTNDLHSHFENWPQTAQFIKKKRQEHEQNGEQMILVDIGDHADRFHLITEATKGQANVDMLNDLQYDAVTIGNNEGITFSHEDLDALYKRADFPVVLSNIYNEFNERPEWVTPYHFIQLKNGMKLCLLGVTVFYEKFYKLLGWKVTDPFQSLVHTVNQVKDKADIIVLLSHLGISDDEIIAQEFLDIQLILGGHTHHVLENGKEINQTLLAGAGKYGQYVGHVKLDFHAQEKLLVSKTAMLHSMEREETCKETEVWLATQYQKSEELLSEPVVVLHEDLSLDWFQDSAFPSLMASAIREWCEGEVSMVNAGMLLEPLKSGVVTKKDLHRICPHPINPCKVEIKGDVLQEVIIQSREKRMEALQLKGLGFRGKVMGRMVFDGIEVSTVTLSDGKEHVNKIIVNGEPIDLDRIYSVATVDMFTLGPLYPEISHAKKKTYYMPEMLRDLLAWKLRKIPYNE
ncbi:bifunctional metallophosphatase/5'-nucleotidase [Metabacillus herbersteinensis]|uniref:Bifunctional metallophosphatase/5'-nucleotidase n=1 Tax=Metabacillus herbersteinensis TaxID=283816 RepID=A0ABV6GB46_9BACI